MVKTLPFEEPVVQLKEKIEELKEYTVKCRSGYD